MAELNRVGDHPDGAKFLMLKGHHDIIRDYLGIVNYLLGCLHRRPEHIDLIEPLPPFGQGLFSEGSFQDLKQFCLVFHPIVEGIKTGVMLQFRLLQSRLAKDSVFWINATDPVPLCGLSLEGIKGTLPKRVAGAHLVYKGKDLVLISERNGKDITIHAPADDPRLQEYYCSLRHLLTRRFQPLRQITMESVNKEPATANPYLDSLKISFDVLTEFKKITLYRKLS